MNNETQAKCYWLTGLSATGKTTLATLLAEYIRVTGRSVIQLDGGQLRKVFSLESFAREERLAIGMHYSGLCKLIVEQDIDVVIGVIGLFDEIHTWNRINIPGYVEVFIDTPLDELRRRDPKGIYSKVFGGEISNVAGVDIAVDFPKHPDVHLSWSPERTKEVMFNELVGELKALSLLP